MDCQEESRGISIFQEGNDERSLRDLEDYQEGSRSIPYFQVGRDEKMRLSVGLINSASELESAKGADRAGKLGTEFRSADAADRVQEEENQNDILMIEGNWSIPTMYPGEAKMCCR
jgi:hypothetical protein